MGHIDRPAYRERGVAVLAADASMIVRAQGMKQLTVISGTGATATVSRVDSPTAAAHTTGTENQFTVAATTKTVTVVDWPFYLVSVAGGSCRVGIV